MLRNFIQHAKASLVQRLPQRRAKPPDLKVSLPWDPALAVTALYRAAFGRLADPGGLANCIQQLQSGVSLEALAEELVSSAEFQARHGSSQKVETDFLETLYRNGLGRKSDPEGLADWLAAGEKGATRGKVLAAFASSDEAMTAVATLFANAFYKTAFGRLADQGGLAHCVHQLQSGASLEGLAEGLAASDEFRIRHRAGQSVDTEYLSALYRNGLNRQPDPEGLSFWLAAGQQGATRAKVLIGLASSNEALEKTLAFSSIGLASAEDLTFLANSLYKTAFGRSADPGGLANCVRQLQSGVSLEVLAEQIAGSAEFKMRHGSGQKVDIKYVTALYRYSLGVQPSLENLAFWLAEGKKGVSRAEMLARLAGSDQVRKCLLSSKLDNRTAYRRWVALNDTISDIDRVAIRAHIAGLLYRPLISVIMAVGKTSKTALHDSLNSVFTQLYPYWELCVSVDAVTEPLLENAILGQRSAPDLRIRVARSAAGESFAAATNAALNLATGEYAAFLRPGDILPQHALYEVAFELGQNTTTDIAYSDNDHLDAIGDRFNPWFKPGWDPDLLLAQDYISPFAVYRQTLLEQLGFLRSGFEGAEFHDLALRTTGATAPDRIRHIPAILYHRRENKELLSSENGSAGIGASAAAARRAIRDHLDSRGDTNAILKPAPLIPGAIRVEWPLPEHLPLVSVIVPTRDRADLLARCVDGVLQRTDYANLELLIVDNGSSELATHALFDQISREDSRVRILHQPGPFNYAALNNMAAREANGEVLVLLNSDIDVIESGWLRELVSLALRLDVGIAGAKLLYANEQVQHAGVVLGPEGRATHLARLASRNDPGHFGQLVLPRTLSAVTCACAAIRRAVFFEVGGFDEVNLPVLFNDIDLCLRLGDHGYRVVWTPFAELFHLESASRGLDSDDPVKRERGRREWQHLYRTWGSLLDSADPFHNPNLLYRWDCYEIPSSSRRQKPWHSFVEQALSSNRYFPAE
jgi:GT2 family glycosyltransferase